MKYKVLCLALCVAMLAGLIACTQQQIVEEPTPTEEMTPDATTMPKKASRTSPSVARRAGTLVNPSAPASVRCTTPFARRAARPPRFLSFPRTTGPSIAPPASRRAREGKLTA